MRYFVYYAEAGVPRTGLTPTWLTLFRSETGAAVVTPNVSVPITEVGGGFYVYEWDSSNNNGVVGVMDAGAILSLASERYQRVNNSDNGTALIQAVHNYTFGKKVKRGGAVPTSLEVLKADDLTTRVVKFEITGAGSSAETWEPE